MTGDVPNGDRYRDDDGAGRPDPVVDAVRSPVPPRRWLTAGVASVGGASFFSDAGHELATSILPTFLTSTLHAGPGALGAIDGVADALTGLSKLAGGPLANDPGRRSRLASGGYVGTAVATAAIGLTTAVWQVAGLRAVAWISRGIRSPARDMLLTTLAREDQFGRAFGVERAGDNAGAIIGPLLASVLVGAVGVRHAILLAIIPGLLAAAAITVAAREARRTMAQAPARRTFALNLRALHRAGIGRTLAPVALFEMGNLATTLLILRGTDLLGTSGTGRDLTAATSLAIVLYAAHNAFATAAALVAGRLADAVGGRRVLASAAVVYVAGYLGFAVGPRGWPALLVAFALSGIGIGFGETAQSVMVARGVPSSLRGNGFGLLGLTQAVGDLVATVVAGALWSAFGPTVAFSYAAAWMALSAVAALGTKARPAR